MPRNTLLLGLVSLTIGTILGFAILQVIPKLSYPSRHPLYRILNIQKPHIYGFAPYWLSNRADQDYSHTITNFTYFGLTLETDGSIKKLVNPREEEPGWTRLNRDDTHESLRQMKQKQLTTALAVHMSSEEDVAHLLTDPKRHARNLVQDVAPVMDEFDFDELNLDIESFKEASPESQIAFTTFVEEIRSGMDQEALGSLSIDVSPTALVRPFITDVKKLVPLVDKIILMTYDYHYLGSPIAGPVSPLGGATVEREFDVATAIEEAVKVAPPDMLLLGIPLYGYEYETISPDPLSPAIPGGASVASHERIQDILQTCEGCQVQYDELSEQPFLIYPSDNGLFYHQIYYEDSSSLDQKLDLARDYKLGGVALWALGYEGENLFAPLQRYKNSQIN